MFRDIKLLARTERNFERKEGEGGRERRKKKEKRIIQASKRGKKERWKR